MIELYHFCHCPYCIRVHLALGYLKTPYQSIVVGYDNVELPTKLIGKKILPIVRLTDGRALSESLDIIEMLDTAKRLKSESLQSEIVVLSSVLEQVAKSLHSLAIPYWVEFPEFDAGSRAYFLAKQEKKRGTLADIISNKKNCAKELPEKLGLVAPYIERFSSENILTILDVMLASHLFPLYVIEQGALLSPGIKNYLDDVSGQCQFNYLAHIKQTISPT